MSMTSIKHGRGFVGDGARGAKVLEIPVKAEEDGWFAALRERVLDELAVRRGFYARFAVLHVMGLALLAAAWANGLLFKPFEADKTGMCYVIAGVFAAGVGAVAVRDWKTVRWAGNALVYLGLAGTVLGLIMTVNGLSASDAASFESFKRIVAVIYIGSGTALYTNLLATIGYLWLGTVAHFLARQEV